MKDSDEVKLIVRQLDVLAKTTQKLCNELIEWLDNCEKEGE